jgi:hypothetical protein
MTSPFVAFRSAKAATFAERKATIINLPILNATPRSAFRRPSAAASAGGRPAERGGFVAPRKLVVGLRKPINRDSAL